jgi:hypothetical protein
VSTQDALMLAVCVILAVPLGAVFEIFMSWVLRQRKPVPRTPQGPANTWVYAATMGVGFNAIMALSDGYKHRWEELQTSLATAAIFTAVCIGSWMQSRRSAGGRH